MGDHIPGCYFAIITFKQDRLSLQDPTHTAQENWTLSYVVTGHIVATIRGKVEFRSVGQSELLRGGGIEIQWQKIYDAVKALEEVNEEIPPIEVCHLLQGYMTNVWLLVVPSTIDRTDIE